MKTLLPLLLTSFVFPLLAVAGSPLREIPFKTMEGKDATLRDYSGKVVLLVNVASRCGNTPQYSALEKLYKDNASKGFIVIGFPSNDFGGQ